MDTIIGIDLDGNRDVCGLWIGAVRGRTRFLTRKPEDLS